jgi:hypothetical protein
VRIGCGSWGFEEKFGSKTSMEKVKKEKIKTKK